MRAHGQPPHGRRHPLRARHHAIKPVPEVVWERVGEVREVVYRTIEELSPPRWSFVFTNVLQAGDRADEAVVDRLARLAEARGSLYLPVRVRCELDELIARVPNPDRRARQKWIDPDAVRTFIGTTVLVDLERHDPLDLDTTTRRPEESAQLIVDHWIAHR